MSSESYRFLEPVNGKTADSPNEMNDDSPYVDTTREMMVLASKSASSPRKALDLLLWLASLSYKSHAVAWLMRDKFDSVGNRRSGRSEVNNSTNGRVDRFSP